MCSVRKIWSADELMAMSPSEREATFLENSSTDIDDVPAALLDRTRNKIQAHIRHNETASAHDT